MIYRVVELFSVGDGGVESAEAFCFEIQDFVWAIALTYALHHHADINQRWRVWDSVLFRVFFFMDFNTTADNTLVMGVEIQTIEVNRTGAPSFSTK